jgi:hypothetical protein
MVYFIFFIFFLFIYFFVVVGEMASVSYPCSDDDAILVMCICDLGIVGKDIVMS